MSSNDDYYRDQERQQRQDDKDWERDQRNNDRQQRKDDKEWERRDRDKKR